MALFILLYRKFETTIFIMNSEEVKPKLKKGSMCSVSGNKYEKDIHSILVLCKINENSFNTQNEKELGGSSATNDIVCNYQSIGDIGVEVKIHTTPDWMQCSIKYNKDLLRWEGSEKGKIPLNSRVLFNELLNNTSLFGGLLPPFLEKKMTYNEWKDIKKNNPLWKDHYITIPDNTIQKMYRAKGCQYIQISNYGLYHLGEDVCGFQVPEFLIEQQLRIRIKIHSTCDKEGFCHLSITAACQPKKIKTLTKSPYSLDDQKKLPENLHYNELIVES